MSSNLSIEYVNRSYQVLHFRSNLLPFQRINLNMNQSICIYPVNFVDDSFMQKEKEKEKKNENDLLIFSYCDSLCLFSLLT